jgi:hypothetical protein
MFFEFFASKAGEHQFAAYNEDHNLKVEKEDTLFFDKHNNRIKSFWRIPAFKEILDIEITIE